MRNKRTIGQRREIIEIYRLQTTISAEAAETQEREIIVSLAADITQTKPAAIRLAEALNNQIVNYKAETAKDERVQYNDRAIWRGKQLWVVGIEIRELENKMTIDLAFKKGATPPQ